MIRRLSIFLLCLLCLACNGFGSPLAVSTPGESQPTATTDAVVATPLLTPTSIPVVEPTQPVGGVLRIWVPPIFDPSKEQPADILFRSRLEQFEEQNPDWTIDVRVKALSGPAGLVEAMSAASAAAPDALPDLVALPRSLLESAASKGLLRPYDGLSDVVSTSDWFDYSRELARVQNNYFGLPIGGDALVLVYRSNVLTASPASWTQLNATGLPMIFPISDSNGTFPLNLYLGAGGPVVDESGAPTLDQVILTQVLTFTESAGRAGVMPNWLGPYENYDQAWQLYQEGRSTMVVNWASRFLQENPTGSALGLLPTPDESPFGLATGWVWALVATDPERQKLAVELAEFLVDDTYLLEWSLASGYLPVYVYSPGLYADQGVDSFISQLCTISHLYPPSDVMAVVNPLLAQAQTQVFKLNVLPEEAAQQAIDALP